MKHVVRMRTGEAAIVFQPDGRIRTELMPGCKQLKSGMDCQMLFIVLAAETADEHPLTDLVSSRFKAVLERGAFVPSPRPSFADAAESAPEQAPAEEPDTVVEDRVPGESVVVGRFGEESAE